MNDAEFLNLVYTIRDGILFAFCIWLAAGRPNLVAPGGITPGPTPPPRPTPTPTPTPTPPQPPLRSAKGSWYSQYQGKYTWIDNGDAPGSNALGVPDADQGVSFFDRSTLGHWFEVHAPNGVVSIEQQTDIGPATSTGRGIDISAAAAERFGYSPKNFPTNGTFQWRLVPAPAEVAGLSPVAQAISYQKVRGTAPTPTPPSTSTPPWLTLARSLIGINENDNPSQIVNWSKAIAAKFPDMAVYSAQYTNASIPWCGQFVAYVLSQNGIRPVFGPTDTDKYLWAFAWKDWGTDASGNPQPGDVLVFKWSSGGGHVTLYDHEVDDDYYHCTGGNQGNPGQVSTESMPMSACIAIRRPPSA